MTQTSLEKRIEEEVNDWLAVFGHWITGQKELDWDAQLASRLDLNGIYVSSKGIVQTLGELSEDVRAAHGANPDYRVQPGLVRVIDRRSDRYVIMYEEHTSGSRLEAVSSFVRVVTAVLQEDKGTRRGFRWIHVHESQRNA